MRTIAYLLAAGFVLPSVVLSAELSFDDKTVGVGKSFGFSAKGAGFVGEPLRFFQKVAEKSFEIKLVDKGSAHIPINTTVQLQNANDDNHPTDMAYPAGSVSWYVDNESVDYPTYTFQVSAGGKLIDFDKEEPYQIELLIDGKSHGVTKTDPSTYWNPSEYEHVPFHKSSRIQVIFSPLALEEEVAVMDATVTDDAQHDAEGLPADESDGAPTQQDEPLNEREDGAL